VVSVQLESTTKAFGSTVAVDGVTLSIGAGELFFLLGPSGCGKTTCLRMVAGFYEPTSGRILFGDRRMDGVAPHLRNTGMVFQSYALWPHLSVYENVAYGLDVRRVGSREKRERTERALAIVHMEEHARKSPNQLSGGQQQRVALARALVIEPDVLLLDEPLSNLDARLRVEMRQEIRRIHRESGVTAIYVTHDQVEALSMADRMAVMNRGRVEQLGSPREVYKHPANAFVAGFIGESNFLRGTVTATEPGQTRVQTELGDVTGIAAADLPVGSPAVCSVRPESLSLAPDDASAPNRLTGMLISSTYLGAVEELKVDCGPVTLAATIHSPGPGGPRTGDRLALWVATEDVIVLADEGASP